MKRCNDKQKYRPLSDATPEELREALKIGRMSSLRITRVIKPLRVFSSFAPRQFERARLHSVWRRFAFCATFVHTQIIRVCTNF